MKLKQKLITLSLILTLTGAVIAIAGFGTAGFNFNRLKENAKEDVWYQTIHMSNNELWYGIKLGRNGSLGLFGYTD